MEKTALHTDQPIGITMGCPVGIGPEIILRFLNNHTPDRLPVVVGDIGVLKHTASELGIDAEIVQWNGTGAAVGPGVIPVCETSHLDVRKLRWGQPDALTGAAMAAYIQEAVRLIHGHVLAGMVTCPIAKSALHMAGYNYPGHTEFLAELCDCNSFAMMMAGSSLRVVLATIHVPFAEIIQRISVQSLVSLISLSGKSLIRDFGIRTPRIAVAGINPHAGESGIFGTEESRIIAPAVNESVSQGWQVTGPLPPDTVFLRAASGEFDLVVCMYHDQGLIPFKMLHFDDGVNVTIGLPIVRTSVDHGTAYDIAGQGIARPESLVEAYRTAEMIISNRHEKGE